MTLCGRSRIRRTGLGLLVALTSWMGLSAGAGGGSGQGDPQLAAELTAALNTALAETTPGDDLELLLGCLEGERFRTLAIHRGGVGIWNDESQFELRPETVRELLLALRAADFAWMEASYGGRHDRSPPAVELTRPADAAYKIVCRLSVTLGEVGKTVSQLFGGRQHPPFRELTDRLFEIAEPVAAGGVRATDLGDGLTRVATGELAAAAFQLLLVRGDAAGGGDPGWMMRIEGRRVAVRAYAADGGLGDERSLELAPAELSELAGELAASGLEELPRSVFTSVYTDFTVRVLAYDQQIEGRRFGGRESVEQQEARQRLEGIVGYLQPLARRVLAAAG